MCKDKDKKDFITIGSSPLWVVILDSVIRGIVGFITLKFLKTIWQYIFKREKKQ